MERNIEAWRLLLVSHAGAVRAIEAELGRAGQIALTWYDVLLELRREEQGLRMQDLAERVTLSRSRVSRLVGELEGNGLVRRVPDGDDGRATRATITDDGRERLRAAWPVYRDAIDRHVTSHLSATDIAALTRILGKVVKAQTGSLA